MARYFRSKGLQKSWIVLLVVLPLLITGFAAWVIKSAETLALRAEFNHLTIAHEKAMQQRLDSYVQALLGGKGFFQGSSEVTPEDWRRYSLALDMAENLPGVHGIGLILQVPHRKLDDFVSSVRRADNSQFKIRPEEQQSANYVIYLIEPLELNREAMGFNIASESNRRQAANVAMATGRPAITQRILLVQDAEKTPGFLLMLPIPGEIVSLPGLDTHYPSWVFTAFLAKSFFNNLSTGQGRDFRLEVYDHTENPEYLIFDSEPQGATNHNARFVVQKTVNIMQQKWFVRWSSMESFEAKKSGQAHIFVLIIGVVFTIFMGLFLFLTFSKEEHVSFLNEKKIHVKMFIPVVVLLITSSGAILLHNQLYDQEQEQLNASTISRLFQIESRILDQYQQYINRLNKIAPAWIDAGYAQLALKDQWSHAVQQNQFDMQGLLGFSIVDAENLQVLNSIQTKKSVNIDGAVNDFLQDGFNQLVEQRPKASVISQLLPVGKSHYFIMVHPVIQDEKAVSYLLAVFELESFIDPILNHFKVPESYNLALLQGKTKILFGGPQYSNGFDQLLHLGGQDWVFSLSPNTFTHSNSMSYLPQIVLIIGLASALLISMVIHFVQKIKSNARLIADKQHLLATFIKHAPMSLAMFDERGRYIVATSRWYKFYKLHPKKSIGQLHPYPTLWLEHTYKFEGKEVLKLEERLNYHDGSLQAWMRYVVCHWFKENGQSGGIIVFAENITEEKNVALMKNEFVSTVNHELRTPLTAIQGALGLLQKGAKNELTPKYQKLLENSFENCKNLTRIINDILDLEKIAAGKLSFEYAQVSLVPILEQAIRLNDAYAQKYDVHFALEVPTEPVYIWADPDRFTQCLSNLLSNAAKFSHDIKTVHVRLFINDNLAVIEVEDHGQGIPLAFQGKVFQRFAQADSASTRAQGGTGLGLSITKSMIDSMGGEISFESIVEKGTVFRIHFPLYTTSNMKTN